MSNEAFINSVNLNARTDFPYLVLDGINGQSYPRTPGFQVMHWHTDANLSPIYPGALQPGGDPGGTGRQRPCEQIGMSPLFPAEPGDHPLPVSLRVSAVQGSAAPAGDRPAHQRDLRRGGVSAAQSLWQMLPGKSGMFPQRIPGGREGCVKRERIIKTKRSPGTKPVPGVTLFRLCQVSDLESMQKIVGGNIQAICPMKTR